MELLGHNFFVFCNAETDQVNVVYKRKGNTDVYKRQGVGNAVEDVGDAVDNAANGR